MSQRGSALGAYRGRIAIAAACMLFLGSAQQARPAEKTTQRPDAAAEYSARAIALAKKRYWDDNGFTLSPNQLYDRLAGPGDDVEQDEEMAKLYAADPTLWKRVASRLSKQYASLQKEINQARFSAVSRYRTPIARALTRLVQIRGGGSESAVLAALVPAEAEWILRQIAIGRREALSDEDFQSSLKNSIILADESRTAVSQIARVVAELRRVEQGMTPQQIAAQRHEILTFFTPEG